MKNWIFFRGGVDFGRYVSGFGFPDSERSWYVSYTELDCTDLSLCIENGYCYVSYSLPLKSGDAFGVDKIELDGGGVVWSFVYDKTLNAELFCFSDLVFVNGLFINKADGSVFDSITFSGYKSRLFFPFCSGDKLFLSQKGIKAQEGGFFCDLRAVHEKKDFSGQIVCSLSDGRVVRSNGSFLDVLTSRGWVSNDVGFNSRVGHVISYNNSVVAKSNGLHFFECDEKGYLEKRFEALFSSSGASVLLRGEKAVVFYDSKTSIARVFDMGNYSERQFRFELDESVVSWVCVRGDVLYGTVNDRPVGYSLTSGDRVWSSDYEISTSRILASSQAVLYQFIAGGIQCYWFGPQGNANKPKQRDTHELENILQGQ